MGTLSPWHWAILIAVIVLLFGAQRLPEASRSLGKSMRIFRSEIRELHTDEQSPSITASDAGESCSPAPSSPNSASMHGETVQ
jgi:sec-independent protein translocase protein TatA